MTKIAHDAYNDNPLTDIVIGVIGRNVAEIGSRAFAGCVDIDTITVYADNIPLCDDETVFSAEAYKNTQLLVPAGTRQEYAAAPVWHLFSMIGQSTCAVKFDYTPEQIQLSLPETFNGIVKFNGSLEFGIVPEIGYQISDVQLNGVYVTGNIVDGTFTVNSIKSDMALTIGFEQRIVSLSIHGITGGRVNLVYRSGDMATIQTA